MNQTAAKPGFWAELMEYASKAIRDALHADTAKRRAQRLSDARIYINLLSSYEAPRLP